MLALKHPDSLPSRLKILYAYRWAGISPIQGLRPDGSIPKPLNLTALDLCLFTLIPGATLIWEAVAR